MAARKEPVPISELKRRRAIGVQADRLVAARELRERLDRYIKNRHAAPDAPMSWPLLDGVLDHYVEERSKHDTPLEYQLAGAAAYIIKEAAACKTPNDLDDMLATAVIAVMKLRMTVNPEDTWDDDELARAALKRALKPKRPRNPLTTAKDVFLVLIEGLALRKGDWRAGEPRGKLRKLLDEAGALARGGDDVVWVDLDPDKTK